MLIIILTPLKFEAKDIVEKNELQQMMYCWCDIPHNSTRGDHIFTRKGLQQQGQVYYGCPNRSSLPLNTSPKTNTAKDKLP